MTNNNLPERRYNVVQAALGSALFCAVFVWIPLFVVFLWALYAYTN